MSIKDSTKTYEDKLKTLKVIKITPTEIKEITDYRNDEIYKDTVAGYVLNYPSIWKYKKYNLTMIMKDIFSEKDQYNRLATEMYRKLKSMMKELDDDICGDILIINEDTDLCDFTLEDMKYIIEKMKTLKR